MNKQSPPFTANRIMPPLAATLHDLGKFAQRTGLFSGTHDDIGVGLVEKEFSCLLPPDWLNNLRDAVADHHRGNSSTEIAKVVQVSDRLASTEPSQYYPQNNSLIPIFSQVKLKSGTSFLASGYRLQKLVLEDGKAPENPSLFPDNHPPFISSQDYKRLWADFLKEVNKLASFGLIDNQPRFLSWLSLLRKYLTFMPAFTSQDENEYYHDFPDVSLYEHLKTSAAIASCLVTLGSSQLAGLHSGEETETKVAKLVRGDFTGIQDFIYAVAKPAIGGTFKGVGKRLRGRSFYLTLLGDVLVDWLVRQLGLTSANILYSGGGRFDLLIPADSRTENTIITSVEKIQKWLLGQFNGKFGVEIGFKNLKEADFGNIGPLSQSLDAKIAENKQRKWLSELNEPSFFIPKGDWHHSCPSCHTKEVKQVKDEGELCDQCKIHENLGGVLPHITYLGWVYGDAPEMKDVIPTPFGDPFGVKVFPLKEGQEQEFFKSLKQPQEAVLYRINSADDFIPDQSLPGMGLSFRFLAKNAAFALNKIKLRNRDEPTNRHDTLDFEEIAELSQGAKYMGVLKADVDHLGLVFALGLQPLSLSRLSSLSQAIDLFFSGWINKLCDRTFQSWKQESGKGHPWREKVSGLFYVAYSGGDDLLIIGPWDQTLELAVELQRDFARYTAINPDITLSAGCVLVKPHFPVQRFTWLAGEAVNKAKNERGDRNKGRNQAAVFDHLVQWTESPGSLRELIALAKDIYQRVEGKEVPRTLVHDIGRLYQKFYRGPNGEKKPLLTPQLYYTLTRRLKADVRKDLLPSLLAVQEYLPIVVSYVSLATRKE